MMGFMQTLRKGFLPMALCGLAAFGMAASDAEAARIDAYRDILLGGSYTIRYDNITPAPRVTNRDKVDIFGKNGMSVERNDYLTNRQTRGIVTSNGRDKYEEVGDGNMDMCRLSKGNEDFYFTKYKKGDGYEYFGTERNKVKANAKNYVAEIVEGESYGDSEVSRLLNAMLPPDRKNAAMTNYTYADGGSLPSGLSYEDYVGHSDGMGSVIRYYFSGGTLVKIAGAQYWRQADGSINGNKCIIRINEFSAAPDRSLLQLPNGLEDVTERGEKKK